MKTGSIVRTRNIFGLTAALLLTVAIIVLVLQNDDRIFESPTLLAVLNAVFLTAVSLITAVIAILVYIRIGLWRFLALAAGSVIFGMTALLAGLFMKTHGPDIPITLYNIGSLLAALCYSTSITHVGSISMAEKVPMDRIVTASVTMILTFAVIGLIIFSSVRHDFPPFFIQGYGSTPIRQVVLGLVIVLFGGTAIFIIRDYQETGTSFNFWFALGLFCITAGFVGVYTMNTAGSILNWVARFSQYIGNLSLLVAVTISIREVYSKSRATEELVATLFQEPAFNYRLIMDINPNGIAVVNQQGSIIRWNRQAEHLFGYSGEEAVGSSLVNLILPHQNETINPILTSMQKQTGNLQENITTDLVATCKDGSTRPVSFSILGTKTSLGWMGVVTLADMTERQQAEARIAHLASFPYFNPNPIIELDDTGHIIYANPGATKRFPDLIALDSKHPFLTDVMNTIRKGEKQQMSSDIKIDDFWFEQVIFYIPGMQSYRLYARDITVRKLAEEKLIKSNALLESTNKELDAFTYSVSHDLRAPLRAIDGFARIVSEDYREKLDDEGRRFLDIIMKNASRMAQLISDLLAFSRLSKQEMKSMPIDMNKLVRSSFEDLLPVTETRNIDIKVNPLPLIQGDPVLLKQVMVNLLSNAIKFTRLREDARIEVGGSTEPDENIYFVKDNGVGFDQQYASKLFGVFQRLHSEEEFEGNGVGLSIVHRIISRHGGRVWAEGKRNEGATIYFAIPRRGDTT